MCDDNNSDSSQESSDDFPSQHVEVEIIEHADLDPVDENGLVW